MPKISLGRNCEVAFAIRKNGFNLESSFLNWAYIGSDDALFRAILNPSAVFAGQYTQVNANMFRCDTLNISFHAKGRFENWKELSKDDPDLLSAVSELKSRSRHLALKLQSQLRGPEKVDAFLKPPRKIKGNLNTFCRDLRQIVDNNYPGNNVRLWVVIEGKGRSVAHVDELEEVYLASVSEYTHDATSGTFSKDASEDWQSLISHSEMCG